MDKYPTALELTLLGSGRHGVVAAGNGGQVAGETRQCRRLSSAITRTTLMAGGVEAEFTEVTLGDKSFNARGGRTRRERGLCQAAMRRRARACRRVEWHTAAGRCAPVAEISRRAHKD